MKKNILFSLLLIVSVVSFSQQTNPAPSLTKQDYLQKSKHQKTAAWILLGGGTTLIITSAVIPLGESTGLRPDPFTFISEGHKNDGIRAAFAGIGILSMLGSIPLFIASGKNKRRAMSLSFKNEKIPRIQKSDFTFQGIPSITLKLSL